MKSILRYYRRLRASLWFIPTLLVMAGVFWAIVLVEIDSRIDPQTWTRWPRLFGAGSDGARGMLETIAGSMISVAGTVFSITLVALSLASSQYTSRVLRNFMSDRTNQTVLGVFVGIFAYCLIVLRTIRAGDEGAFVPTLAVLVGVVLAFVGIGYLIYFIHHISTSIQASEILARIAGETIRGIDRLFPKELGDAPNATDAAPSVPPETRWHAVVAKRSGYIQEVDQGQLIACAQDRKSLVRMERGIGDFVIEGTPLASYSGADVPDESAIDRLRGVYSIGRQRTIDQDAAYGIRQIVDVALKALSPGVNDTTTGVMSLDHLGAILMKLVNRPMESPFRYAEGKLCVLARGPNFGQFVGLAFDQIRQNAPGNVAVLFRLVEVLGLLLEQTAAHDRREILRAQLEAARECAVRTIPAIGDQQPILALASRLLNR